MDEHASIGSADSKTKNIDQTVHPVVFGNIKGANIVATVIKNKQELPLTMIKLDPQLNSQFFPMVVQQSDSVPLVTKSLSPASTVVPLLYDCYDKHLSELDKHGTHIEVSSLTETTSTEPFIGLETEKAPLSSSDTIILSTTMNISDTLPISSLQLTSTDSFVGKILAKDGSLVSSTNKPFSLLTNISDRSVSLESIPSFGLLQADHEHTTSLSLSKIDSMEPIAGTSQVILEASESNVTPSFSEINVENRIPNSVIVLMKDHINQFKPTYGKDSCSENSKNSSNNLSCQATKDYHDHSCAISIKRQKNVDEENSDTDSDLQIKNVSSPDKNTLTRCDTVILNADKEQLEHTESDLLRSDTIILPKEKKAHRDERTLKGDSITSFNGSDHFPLKIQLSELLRQKTEFIDNTLMNVSSTPLPVQLFGNFNNSLYLLTCDEPQAAVKYISSNPCIVGQTQGFNHTDVLPLNLSISAAVKNVETKETQTELIFGTDTIYFKSLDTENEGNIHIANNLIGTEFTKSSLQPSVISSIVALNDSAPPLSQLQSSPKNVQIPIISLEEPTTHENLASCNLQPASKATEYGITPLQTSEPEFPDASTKSDSISFKCIECMEIFKNKNDLITHEKLHKREFKCDSCNATFTRVGNFTRHRKIHNLEMESHNAFKCHDCGREFLQRCDLKRHSLIHAKQEPYRCEQCGKGYIRRSDLVVHMRFHNKDKAFKCNMCDKRFFQTGDLSRHVRRAHMPDRQLICGHCNRKYACESTLLRHMKAVHKDIILHTAIQKLGEPDSSGNISSINTKDVLFTMSESPETRH